MKLPRLGHAVIVNNVASEMRGSQKDVAALKAAYEKIGFDVQIHNDCSAQVVYLKNISILPASCFCGGSRISHGKPAWDTQSIIWVGYKLENSLFKPATSVNKNKTIYTKFLHFQHTFQEQQIKVQHFSYKQ